MMKPVALSKETIQEHVGLSSFQKGERYAENEAIRQGRTKGSLIQGLCQGTEWSPYDVSAIVEGHSIQQAYCSCPVGAGGRCKHVAALLLTWLNHPENFAEWEEIKRYLKECPTDVLVELIDLMEDQIGDFSDVIQSFKQKLSTIPSPRLAKYLRRIEEAFKASKFPWYHPDEGETAEIAFELSKIRSSAHEIFRAGEYEEAIIIYKTLIQHILNYLEDRRDAWGNLHNEIRECIREFGVLLEKMAQNRQARQKIFRILFGIIEEQSYRADDIGATEAKEMILKQADKEERSKIISWVEALKKDKKEPEEDEDLYSEAEFYQAQPDRPFSWIEDFLIDLRKDSLPPEVYLQYYRQTGQVVKLVKSLLELNRLQEAKEIAYQPEYNHRALALAPLFVEHERPEIAEELILRNINEQPTFALLQWLKEFYKRQVRLQEAFNQAIRLLYMVPRFSNYQEVQDLAQDLNIWKQKHKEIIEIVKTLDNPLLLVEIYLDEKAFEKAIEAFQALPPLGYYGAYNETSKSMLGLRLATAAKHKYPHFAIKVYQENVEELVEERNRDSYQKASHYLKLIRDLYKECGQERVWHNYLRGFIQTYSRLKALKEELQLAGLI